MRIKLERRGRIIIAALAPVAVVLGGNGIEWALETLKSAGVSEDTIVWTTVLSLLSIAIFVKLESNATAKPSTKPRKPKTKAKPQPSHPVVDDDDD